MQNKLRIILFGVLLLSALVLSMSVVPKVSASSSFVGSTSSSALLSQIEKKGNPYAQGFRDGFRQGFKDGRQDCHEHYGHHQKKGRHSYSDYDRGYADGYSKGYQEGFYSCHHKK